MIRRFLHAVLILLAVVPWAFGCLLFSLALLLTILADRLWPNADHGNCWSFVGPRWAKHGGYLLIRPADGVRVFGKGIIPHVIWLKSLPKEGVVLEQTFPLFRSKSRWLPWRTLYFKYKLLSREREHNVVDLEA